MAHIFKHPTDQAKGILVFTHKEVGYFTQFWKETRFPWFNEWQAKLLPKTALKPFFKKRFEQFRRQYFIGIHFGWHHENYPLMPFLDFYMGGEGTVSFEKGAVDPFFIPLNSRSFSSKKFQAHHRPQKYWDIICISNSAKFKNLDLFLKNIRKLYDQGKAYKVLLLVVSKKVETEDKFYVGLEDDYHEWFSAEERENFTLMKLSPNLSFIGMSQSILAHFLNDSKVFTLFSQKEGESRVISEALLCGLPVVVKNDLMGGGRDLLHEGNAVFFEDYGQAYQSFIHAVENIRKYDTDQDKISSMTREDSTVPRLKTYFEDLYRLHGQTFDGQLINEDNLAFRLPGHYYEVPWNRGRFQSADIFTHQQFELFMNDLQIT